MIDSHISFIIECEKLKSVLRRSTPIDHDRRENTAEHSWSVVVAAMILAPQLAPDLDRDRIIRMLAIHDIVEIDAGDTFVYADQTGKFEREQKAAERLFGILPEETSQEFHELWLEFESEETAESQFANAIDRLLPLLQNFHSGGASWTKYGVTYEQVHARNFKICKGSPEIWNYVKDMIDEANRRGFLPKAAEQ